MTGVELFGYILYYTTIGQTVLNTNSINLRKKNTDSWAYRINDYINKSTTFAAITAL